MCSFEWNIILWAKMTVKRSVLIDLQTQWYLDVVMTHSEMVVLELHFLLKTKIIFI